MYCWLYGGLGVRVRVRVNPQLKLNVLGLSDVVIAKEVEKNFKETVISTYKVKLYSLPD